MDRFQDIRAREQELRYDISHLVAQRAAGKRTVAEAIVKLAGMQKHLKEEQERSEPRATDLQARTDRLRQEVADLDRFDPGSCFVRARHRCLGAQLRPALRQHIALLETDSQQLRKANSAQE